MIEAIWLVHPEIEMCNAFAERFSGMPGVKVVQSRFEDLEPQDCFVTVANAFGMMTPGIDAILLARSIGM